MAGSRVLLTIAVLLLGTLAAWAQQPHRPRMPIERSRPYQRMLYFYQQREYPLGFVPAGAQQHACQQAAAKLALERRARYDASSAPTLAWTEIGPRPLLSGYSAGEVSGRVTAIAIDPRDSGHVYLGTAGGGVWKTIDGGANWTPLTDHMPSPAIGALAIAPSNPDTVYAGLGEGNFSFDSYYGMGLYKSSDGGAHWTHITGPFYGPLYNRNPYWAGAHIGALAVKPDDPGVVLAAAYMIGEAMPGDHSGVWRSPDGGNTWSLVLAGAPGTQVLFDSTNPNIAYAALGSASEDAWGVYRSGDAGASWTRINGASATLPLSNLGRIALALQHSAGQAAVLYAGVGEDMYAGSGNLLGLYKAIDDGASPINWTRLASAPNYCGDGGVAQCWYDNVVAVHPHDANLIFVGGSAGQGIYRTLDGGRTWSPVRTGADGGALHADHHALAFSRDGSLLYLGNDGGVWKANAPAAASISYINLNRTLGTLQFYPGLAIHPANPGSALAGSQDNGTELYEGSMLWRTVTCGDGGWNAYHPTAPAIVYAACRQITPLRSMDGGQTWQDIRAGIATTDPVLFIPPLVLDARTPNVLYFGTHRLYQSTEGGANWTPISGDLSKGGSVITTIAVAPFDSNMVYVGTRDGNVQVSTNALVGTGATWTRRRLGLPNRAVTAFAVSAADPNVAYVTVSGFTWGADTLGHVFKTSNAGQAWIDVSGAGVTGLPNSPANAIVIDPLAPEMLYVASDVGVYRSADAGATWTTLGSGLPKSPVVDLKLHAASRTLRAVTHGRGVWDLVVPGVSVGRYVLDTRRRPTSAGHARNR